MTVRFLRYGDPHVRTIRLSRRVVLQRLYSPPPQGRWLLAVDPETLVARIVVQRLPDGFVPDIDGHEDLFPLLMTVERQDGFLEGGDWLVAFTPEKKGHDGVYRSYRIEWDDPNPELMGEMDHVSHPSALQVFLCHSSGDKAAVRKLHDDILTLGFNPWLDELRLLPGQDWKVEIKKAIRKTDVVIVCLSNKSVTKSGFVQAEIKYALDVADEQPEGTIFIIPLRLEECKVPDRLSQWQWVDYYKENGRDQLQRALRTRAATLEFRED
ncbi:toll/interleukin-1 receptor domain-containing protein [Desulfobacterium sp. N47]|uniref:toll/interleukin-1 receptor domain-containing protein n=1 Tax=Desulfobacterium sp. N47 TaxID=3115210 RepID=UPI003F49D0F0